MDDGSLRAKAEKQLQQKPKADTTDRPAGELVHELQVHQIELEMQNEELRQAHVLMEEMRDRYVDLYEFAPLGYITVNREGEIAEINLGAAALLGVDRSKLINRRFSAFVSDQDKDRWHRLFSNMMEHGEAEKHGCDLEMTAAGGSTFFAHLDCLRRDALDAPPVLRVALADVTKLKQTEAELRIAATAFQSLEGLLVTDAKGVILKANQAFVSMTGYSAEEVRGRPAHFLQSDRHSADSACAAMAGSIRNTGAWEGEININRKNGEAFPVRLAISAVKDSDGTVTNYVAAITDITKRRAVEEDLWRYRNELEETVQQRTAELRLERDAAEAASIAKTAFLTNMSHQLRTPLHAILGFSSMVRDDPNLSESQRENLDIVSRNGEHLLNMINDVLEMAKIEAGGVQLERAPLDFGSLVGEVASMMGLRAGRKGLRLELEEVSAFPRCIKGDAARLRQVLAKLVDNAVKFTSEGGVVICVGARPDAPDHLVVEVEDTGPGITPEEQKRLFQPFVQLAKAGTQRGSGLGLAIARQYVQLMGGTLSVESAGGKGAIFRIELPVEAVAEAGTGGLKGEDQAGEVMGLASGEPSYRILIASDQHESQLLLSALMSKIGLDVKAAANSDSCVSIFQDWHPHLIWMDGPMQLMDCQQAARCIRQLPGGRAVKMVAVAPHGQQREMRDAGIDDFVGKPYRFSEICDCLARQLGMKYVYRSEPAASATPAVLRPAMLAVLSVATRSELKDALESLDSERITAIIRRISEADAELGNALSRLAEDFDYPAILNALVPEPH